MRKFENCDVLSVLREIMSHNTKHYQTDFDIDEEILTEAAEEPNALDRRYLWLSRPCGTHCLKEKDVFLFNSPEYSTWTAYAATADEIPEYSTWTAYAATADEIQIHGRNHARRAAGQAVYSERALLRFGRYGSCGGGRIAKPLLQLYGQDACRG